MLAGPKKAALRYIQAMRQFLKGNARLVMERYITPNEFIFMLRRKFKDQTQGVAHSNFFGF